MQPTVTWMSRLAGLAAVFMALAAPGRGTPGAGGGGGGGGERIVDGGGGGGDMKMYVAVFAALILLAIIAYVVSQRKARVA